MSNEKCKTVSFDIKKTRDVISRVKAIHTLLDLSTEDFLLDKLDQENAIKKCKKEINCGWQKISATCSYRSKIPSKMRKKKMVGIFPQLSSNINLYDQKNMKFLFSNSLKYMLFPDSFGYKPFNGVYRTMKFADSNVDVSYNKQLILKKPTILLPLHKSDTIPKDILLLANNKPKPSHSFSSILHNFQLKQSSFFSVPDISGLHITGDCPQILSKNLIKEDVIPQSRNAEGLIDGKHKLQIIAEKIEKSVLSVSKKQNVTEQNKSTNPKPSKPISGKIMSIVKLKVLADQKKNADTCISFSKSLSSLEPSSLPSTLKNKSIDNTKGQKLKKTNNNKYLFGKILRTFNQEQSQSDYNLKSDVTSRNESFLSFGQNLLPLIMGKRMPVCPTIHF